MQKVEALFINILGVRCFPFIKITEILHHLPFLIFIHSAEKNIFFSYKKIRRM